MLEKRIRDKGNDEGPDKKILNVKCLSKVRKKERKRYMYLVTLHMKFHSLSLLSKLDTKYRRTWIVRLSTMICYVLT